MRTGRLLTTALAVTLAVACLDGCGGSSPKRFDSQSPAQIIAAALKATASASSVLVTGPLVYEGNELHLDFRILPGRGATGPIAEPLRFYNFVRTGDTIYVKGEDEFAERAFGKRAAKQLKGRWVKASTTSGQFALAGRLSDVRTLFATVLGPVASLSNAGPTMIGRLRAVAVKNDATSAVLYVTADGTHYPLLLEENGGSGAKVYFRQWSRPIPFSVPAKAVDIETLKAKS